MYIFVKCRLTRPSKLDLLKYHQGQLCAFRGEHFVSANESFEYFNSKLKSPDYMKDKHTDRKTQIQTEL